MVESSRFVVLTSCCLHLLKTLACDVVAIPRAFASCHSQYCKGRLLFTHHAPWHALPFLPSYATECIAFVFTITASNICVDVDGSRRDGQHLSIGLGVTQQT
jgi:hypothetical protein